MKKQNVFHALTLFCCIALVAVCFIPWVYYKSINDSFTGYHVTKFVTGVYYGRAGIFITVFAAIIFLLTIWKNNGAKRVSLFVAALLFAYCIRTYILFTGSLFEGEVVKHPGIYLIVFLSMILLVSSAFPKRV
ncbi:MAG: hypothetical protein WKF88_11685 [Ferruginibacter sp.]